MINTTYSFADYVTVFNHTAAGQYIAADNVLNTSGGIGGITVSMENDQTKHIIGVDGRTLVQKIITTNGTATVTTQQTSGLNTWLTKLWNYVVTADPVQWAGLTIQLINTQTQATTFLTDVSIKKVPDQQLQAQGQPVSWGLMFGNINRQGW